MPLSADPVQSELPLDSAQPTDPQEPQVPDSEPAPAPAAAAQPAAAPSFDYKAAYESQAKELAEIKKHAQETAKSQSEMRDLWLRQLDPEGYARRTAPRFVTEEQLEAVKAEAEQKAQMAVLVQQVRGDLESAKEKFPEVFSDIPGADSLILQRWQETGERPTKIAKDLNEALAKSFERRQAKHMADKSKVEEATRGSPRSGTAPSSGPKGKAHGLGVASFFDSLRES
jgi:hypothetical protein